MFLLTVILVISLLPVSLVRSQDKISLQMTWWGSKDRHDRTIKVIDMYMKANPNVDITYEFASWADYYTKLNTQAAGGQLACITQQDYAFIAEWVSRKLLLPLDDYIKSGIIDTSKIADSALEGGRINNQLYGMNLGMNTQGIVLDVDAFKQAGLDLPSTQWTWKDFEDTAIKLHKALNMWGFNADLISETLWKSLYLGLGQNVINEDGTALGYTDDKPLIDFFQMILRLQDAGAIPSADETAEYYNQGPEKTPIVTKLAAMDYRWSNQIVALWAAAGKDRQFKLWALPRSEGGKSQNFMKPSQFFSITAGCKYPEEAAKFINYFTNSKEANDVLFAERGVPISSDVRDYLMPKLEAPQVEMFDFVARMQKDASPIQPPDPPGWGDLRDNVYLAQFANPVIFRKITIEDGVKLLRDKSNEILAKNKK
jgi:multiple sugar transport system substrate-binding protein